MAENKMPACMGKNGTPDRLTVAQWTDRLGPNGCGKIRRDSAAPISTWADGGPRKAPLRLAWIFVFLATTGFLYFRLQSSGQRDRNNYKGQRSWSEAK